MKHPNITMQKEESTELRVPLFHNQKYDGGLLLAQQAHSLSNDNNDNVWKELSSQIQPLASRLIATTPILVMLLFGVYCILLLYPMVELIQAQSILSATTVLYMLTYVGTVVGTWVAWEQYRRARNKKLDDQIRHVCRTMEETFQCLGYHRLEYHCPPDDDDDDDWKLWRWTNNVTDRYLSLCRRNNSGSGGYSSMV